jgi:serine/threonine protein kinase
VTDATSALPLDEGHATWDVLAAQLEALVQRWEAGGPEPVLAEFVPPGSTAVRRLALVELVKLDIDYRYQRGRPKRIEDYLAEFPELRGESGVPCDLIFEEFQARRRAGEPINPADYFNRFPAQTTELARLLNVNAPTEVSLTLRPHPEASVRAGDRLEDFDLQALLGEGAFAKVFLAWQRSMQRRVALKVSSDRGDEPQTLAQLDHPNIVRVYDQRQISDRNLRLLYMPYLPGGTLQDVLKMLRATPIELRSGRLLLDAVDAALAKRGEPIPEDSGNRRRLAAMTWPEAVCFIGARLADALDYAHRQGVLHRDVKPANVLLGADAAPRLADFNVGCCNKLEGANPAAFFGGSIPYMSPEQIEAFNPSHARSPESLDGRADVYSLAVTLWELLTGKRPFPEERLSGDWHDTLDALVLRRKAGLSESTLAALPQNLPPGMRDVLLTCLQADPDRRYAAAGELARQLDLCLKTETRALLHPEAGWRTWVRRHPLLALYPTGLVPNILASWFSIEYNKTEIIADVPHAEEMFRRLQIIVNGAFFPLGVILFGLVAWPVARGLRLQRAHALDEAELAALRRHSLRLGPLAVIICLTAWVSAGVIFPVTLQLTVGGMKLPFFIHFLASQTLCGLIAVSYPLFAVTALVMRTIYPAFFPAATLSPADAEQLNRLDRSLKWYFLLAALVPLLAILMLAASQSRNYVALGVLSAAGFAGIAAAYLLIGMIRADKSALLDLKRE